MKNVIVDGTTYTGVEVVQLAKSGGGSAFYVDEDGTSGGTITGSVSGKVLHVSDAVPDGIKSLKVYDSAGKLFTNPVMLAIANKNLFRHDLLSNEKTDKGITFTKQNDGGVLIDGTASGDYANVAVPIDEKIFQQGKTFTISTGKTEGNVCFKIEITFEDATTETITAKNMYAVFTIGKAVDSASAKIEVEPSGLTVDNEVIYPMLELAEAPSEFEKNSYTTTTYDGTTIPVLPGAVANLWSLADTVNTMTMVYGKDVAAQADYLQEQSNENAENDIAMSKRIDEVSPEIVIMDEKLVFLTGGITVVGEAIYIR